MISTAGSAKEARKIGKVLVEKGLAACVSVIPGVNSFFYWEGKLCQEGEAVILIKTESAQINKIINKIKELHSYEVPEIISFKIEEGEKNYLQWIKKMTKKG